MKYAVEFKEKNKKYSESQIDEAMQTMDEKYPLMTKLAALYNACGHKLPDAQNVFAPEMKKAKISIDVVEIAAAYLVFAKKQEKKDLQKYHKHRKSLLRSLGF